MHRTDKSMEDDVLVELAESSFSYIDIGKFFGGSSPILLVGTSIIDFINNQVLRSTTSLIFESACDLLARQLALNGLTHIRLLLIESNPKGANETAQNEKPSEVTSRLDKNTRILVETLSSNLDTLFITWGHENDPNSLRAHASTCLLVLAAQTGSLSTPIVKSSLKAGISVALLSERSFLLGERLYCFTRVIDDIVSQNMTLKSQIEIETPTHNTPPFVPILIPILFNTNTTSSLLIPHVSESDRGNTNMSTSALTSLLSNEREKNEENILFLQTPSITYSEDYRQIKEDLDPITDFDPDAKTSNYASKRKNKLTPEQQESRDEQVIMKRISTYAGSLHGASTCFNAVLRSEPAGGKSQVKGKPIPSKNEKINMGKYDPDSETSKKSGGIAGAAKMSTAQKIREENEKRILDADLVRQKKVLAVAMETAATGRSLDAKLAALESLRITKSNAQSSVYISMLLAKIGIYQDAWKQEMLLKASLATSLNDADFSYAVSMFEILFEIADDPVLFRSLTELQLDAQILPMLAMFGFMDAARMFIAAWGVSTGNISQPSQLKKSTPATKQDSKGNTPHAINIRLETALARARIEVGKYKVRHSYARFQLLFCGHLASRLETEKKVIDARVRFSPDPWQVALLDAVDANESALICAPTSSGKTFICYYAMEKILRQSDSDTVLYVAPNKALMDQVVADIYARFGHKQYPSKSSNRLFGYLSDFESFHPWEAQVLVTFPEILEKYVTSPLFCESYWKERVKYIILDEIHTISEEGKSSAWEKILMAAQCPILALSATLGNKNSFYRWLFTLQAQAGIPCRLIDHSERYSDLLRYVYVPGECSNTTGASSRFIQNRVSSTNNDLSEQDIHTPSPCPSSMINTTHSSLTSVRKRVPGGGAVLLLHPVLSLSYEDLATNRTLPSDFYFLSGDAVRLWDALHSLVTTSFSEIDSGLLDEISSLNYEKMAIFQKFRITRAEIRIYSTRLMDLLRIGVLEKKISPLFFASLKQLLSRKANHGTTETSQESSSLISNPHSGGTRWLLDTVIPLLVELSVEQKLPAIIFHFDRSFCTQLAIHIIEYLERAEALKRVKYAKEDRACATEVARTERALRRTRDAEKKQGKDAWIEDAMESERMTDMMAMLCRSQQLDPDLVFYDQRWKVSDAQLGELIETQGVSRRMTSPEEKILLRGLYRGIGVHHRGVPKRYLSLVEHLFRLRHLQVVVAGNTLALGINMPCKSVIFACGEDAGDIESNLYQHNDNNNACPSNSGQSTGASSLALTPLDYRQASGRAGRRGYDALGHVVFWGLSKPRMDALITSTIPSVRGDCSLDASMSLQAFHMAKAKPFSLDLSTLSISSNTPMNSIFKKDTTAELFVRRFLTAPLCLLGQLEQDSMSDQDKATSDVVTGTSNTVPALESHFRRLVGALGGLGLLNPSTGAPTVYARLALLIPSQMPAAIIVAYLIRIGWLDLLCNAFNTSPDSTLNSLMAFFCRFVQCRFLFRSYSSEQTLSVPSLPLGSLYNRLIAEIEEYNLVLLRHFNIGDVSIEEKTALPSKSDNSVNVGSLSKHQHPLTKSQEGALVLNARLASTTNLCLKLKAPIYAIPPGVIISGYIWDYFTHADPKRIYMIYGVTEMELWQDLSEFSSFLKQLKEMVLNEPIANMNTRAAISELTHSFIKKFKQMWA